ncbi:MAG: trypsin-like peptidase domain-containing protein [Patescibacteria group bacterium]|nr:trypsin-like peptidase domain-containing protein [Patescibacteria group bacterium]MDD5164760.1 trypsin-like peptidase domain-containing protein [Patescibacteria group bacterium]MDD5534424.1 trypsin-like peptidase domain-containing protein [Patescibacteria group bacterium]
MFKKIFRNNEPIDNSLGADEAQVIWTEKPREQKKSPPFLTFTLALRPVVVIIMISILIGAAAGAVTGFYAGSYALTKFVSYSTPTILHSSSQVATQSQIDPTNTIAPIILGNQEESDIVSAVKKTSPAVVNVIVSKYVTTYYSDTTSPFDELFNDWFGQSTPTPTPNSSQKQKQEVGGGTGFVVSSKDGLILTNKHVASDETAEYTVVTNDGKKYDAKILAQDPFNDIAILKIEIKDLPEVKLGDSEKIQIGQTVIAIGNALGEYRNTVTKGVISGVGRRVVAGDNAGLSEVLENVIQTDAAINLGNSGGPLINTHGEVIGINTAINSQGQMIGFAIPINQAKQVIESVKKYGKIVRPYLGVRYVLINEEIVKKNNLSVNYGALVLRGSDQTELAIIPGGPADKAGIEEGDIILEVNGAKITEENSLSKTIQNLKPGDEVELKILHKGAEKTVKVELEEYLPR